MGNYLVSLKLLQDCVLVTLLVLSAFSFSLFGNLVFIGVYSL